MFAIARSPLPSMYSVKIRRTTNGDTSPFLDVLQIVLRCADATALLI
jgi:hypothetical protein